MQWAHIFLVLNAAFDTDHSLLKILSSPKALK